MNDKIVETIEVVLATIFTGFGGFIFVKNYLLDDEKDKE